MNKGVEKESTTGNRRCEGSEATEAIPLAKFYRRDAFGFASPRPLFTDSIFYYAANTFFIVRTL
jgi:hypothetical protein